MKYVFLRHHDFFLKHYFRPGRKRSSEERRVFPMPTIPDVMNMPNVLPVALTESSSSSSFTESVCTAYDTHKDLNSRTETGIEVSPIQEELESSVGIIATAEKNKTGLITSIIDGKNIRKFFKNIKINSFFLKRSFYGCERRYKICKT